MKLKIDDSLYDKLKEAAETQGYSSADEFVIHILEQAVAGLDEDMSEEEVKKYLKGLGYLK
jgi:hypothetical protein